MQMLFRRLKMYIDTTSLLAIVTAFLLIILYATTGNLFLFIAFIPYAILGAVGIYQYQKQLLESDFSIEDNVTITQIPLEDFQQINNSMNVTVHGLVRASEAIDSVTRQQADNAQEQADVIGNANKQLDIFLALSQQISEQVRQITQASQQAADISEDGQQALVQTLNSMTDIRQQVEAIGNTIVSLAKNTGRIDDIINSVSELATQSNLLALNASIEAARAGKHGRGFAVVADEVRELALESTKSASEIRQILGEIKKSMKDTVEATQIGINNVDAGVSKTQEANQVIVQLASNVRESRDTVGDIYAVVRQQADGMEEIAINMDRIQLITRQNLANVRTVESVSASLTHLATDLKEVVTEATLVDHHSTSKIVSSQKYVSK